MASVRRLPCQSWLKELTCLIPDLIHNFMGCREPVQFVLGKNFDAIQFDVKNSALTANQFGFNRNRFFYLIRQTDGSWEVISL